MARTPQVVENRREQIMDAALRVFARKGFAQATNKDIAREAEITPGLIYHYFDSKAALLQAILESRAPVQVMRALAPDTFDLPPEKMLRLILRPTLRALEDKRFLELLRVYLPELLHNPQASSLGIPAIQEGTEYLAKYLAAQIKRGTLRKMDPALAAQIILGGIMALVLRRQILRDPTMLAYSHEKIIDLTIQLTLRGLLTN